MAMNSMLYTSRIFHDGRKNDQYHLSKSLPVVNGYHLVAIGF